MVPTLITVLEFLACICFVLAVPVPPASARFNLIAAGLALWMITLLLT